MVRRVLVGAGVAVGGWMAVNRIAQWAAGWGVEPDLLHRSLPGDELVPQPSEVDTRSIVIDAPPGAVWPWLVQMGYGRGGWYSYDQLDMKGSSADTILPELQSLAVGDIVPTDPGGGFLVRTLEPGRALVLYADDEMLAGRRDRAGAARDHGTPGVAASGAFLSTGMPKEFAASWAFILEPLEGDRTRLVERLRTALGPPTLGSRALGPLMGFGIFVMMRRQMLGIRDRAERLVREGPVPVLPDSVARESPVAQPT
jgi:hypothetical protein